MISDSKSLKRLYLDIETYSPTDLKWGTYRYAADPGFRILLLSYAYDDEPVKIVDLACGQKLPVSLLKDLTDPSVLKIAHNANFERICLSSYLNRKMPPEQWHCSMIQAYYCGFPGSLQKTGEILNIHNQKLSASGKQLIRFFCKPQKNSRLPVNPAIYPLEWQEFKDYNKRDVEAEREICKRLEQIRPVPDQEWRLWSLDQKINDHGVQIDLELVRKVLRLWKRKKEDLSGLACTLLPGINIRSRDQLLKLLRQKGVELDDLQSETIDQLIHQYTGEIQEILKLRKELTRNSIKKYETFLNSQVNGRVHGIFQFYGAHTGRWAGRLIQPQNLPRPVYENIGQIRKQVLKEDFEGIDREYSSFADALSSIIRTAIISENMLSVADYSAIECRVLAWLADEKWVLEAFSHNKDLYCETAAQMFGIPVEKNGRNKQYRFKGKIATLACGYGGSIAALKAFGADTMGMSEKEMQETVTRWRNANQNIVKLWERIQRAAIRAVQLKEKFEVAHGVFFFADDQNLYCGLPSGRELVYRNARVQNASSVTRSRLFYEDEKTVSTWGGKLTENIVQAIARDLLAQAMLKLDQKGFSIVAHIHDEIVVEGKELKELCRIMCEPVPWAQGLELKAEGYTSFFYRKD